MLLIIVSIDLYILLGKDLVSVLLLLWLISIVILYKKYKHNHTIQKHNINYPKLPNPRPSIKKPIKNEQ